MSFDVCYFRFRTDLLEKDLFTFPIEKLQHFILPYANTCHSVQGLSIDGPVTIFDINTPHIDRYYVDSSHKSYLKSPYFNIRKMILKVLRIKRYLQDKISGYKCQDKIADRSFKTKDYISADWIADEHEKSPLCYLCHETFNVEVMEGKVRTNMTVDRIDNTEAHVKNNSRLCCVQCNVSRSNHY